MSDAPRLSEMVGIDRSARRTESVWPINCALLLLGGAVLWIAFRFLKLNDPRPLYNPWLYTVVTPVVLVSLSLLLRQIVSRVVERSAQVAFLLSLIVHLILLVCALDVVIYTRMWPAFFDALEEEKEKLISQEKKAAQYFNLAASSKPGNKRPDYLRYVPTQHDPSETKLEDDARMQLAHREKADLISPDPKMESPKQAALIERKKLTPSMAAPDVAPAEMSRSNDVSPTPSLSRAEAIEASRNAASPKELQATELSNSRSRSGKSDLAPSAATTAEPLALGLSAPPLGLPRAVGSNSQEPQLAASMASRDTIADFSASTSSPRQREIAVPETSGGRSNAPSALGPSTGSMGKRERTPGGGSGDLNALEPAFLSGGASGHGLGNIARSELGGRNGEMSGRSDGAGVSRGSFSLPKGDLGANLGPPGTGRIDVPETSSSNGVGTEGNSGFGLAPSQQAESGRRARESGSGGGRLRLDIPAPPGLGGISTTPGDGPMIARSTLVSPSMEMATLDVQRFSRDDIGGPLAGGVTGSVPAPAFQQRIDRLQADAGGEAGPIGPQTEQAIERGLEFLAKHQRPEGRWRLQDLDKDVLIRSDTAATGLCLLAYQGAGYTHKDYKYASVNDKALKFLIQNQRPNGDLYIPQDPASDQNAWLYSHGIATLALCEAYGMTQDPELKGPAQLAVKFMVDSQEPKRGGWRYHPNLGSDTSVTGWFMMALKSAQLAGLEVPQRTFDRMASYVQASQVSAAEPHLFRYNPYAPNVAEQRHGLKPTHVMTSVGLLMRMYLGWRRDLPEMQAGTDYLLQHPPELGSPDATKRDTYYWYYATQVMFHMGGERWKRWNDRLRPILLEGQVTQGEFAGSWDPYLPSADLWARYGGRLYVTTMNLLSLEVHYRHLPLYEATAQ